MHQIPVGKMAMVTQDRDNLRMLVAATAGVMFHLLAFFVLAPLTRPPSVMDRKTLPALPAWALWPSRVLQWIQSWPQSLLLLTVLVVLVITRKKDPKRWTFAFLAGVLASEVIFQILSRV